jgi:hypothetical protein
VQAHLFRAEVKDSWNKLEKDWQQLHRELEPIKNAATKTAGEVSSATAALVGALKSGFGRIKESVARPLNR